MKRITAILLMGTAALLLSACGGGGGGSSTPPTPPTPPPPTYTTIEDLEFTTLDIVETWNLIGDVMYTTMVFSNDYNPYRSTQLLDDTSSVSFIKACELGVAELGLTYMCLGVFSSGSQMAWGIDIDSAGNISGNFEFSATGNAYDLALGISDPNYADAVVTGRAYSNLAKTNGNIASTNGGALGTNVATINEGTKNEEEYIGLASMTPSELVTTQANEEIVQKIEKMYDALLDSRE